MKILALDTALGACSVAIVEDGRVLAHRTRLGARGQAEALMPMVEAVRADAGLAFAALDRLAVTVGPGSFTGLRIGLAAARGLALATGLPLVGVTTLRAIERAARADRNDPRPLVVALDARRGEIYLQSFDANGRPLGDALAIAPRRAAALLPDGQVLAAGSGAALLAAAHGALAITCLDGILEPDARWVARYAASLPPPRTGEVPAPLYLRAPDAKLPAAPAPGSRR
ncbi:tRNA (adenosine(37)-N6)-threonylcarbamoyltransferase complex dimerization subunit type 1 TsaB [Oceanibacterium hippocampi]|uniref:tRNA threonylcarbamoyladenosine biosynthesis protein TsaB n=1 Tax=Oceanibacterium hippocampi TaxID=745714 RepID=A0A1Y5RPK8_9PROT|nr:tRNA (adenosine(37)-N6)-threonylcarbamoyltransferase complex dimerization subunit type 1 TsaB [Oceanibacterium hippocampi]SLN19515.1 tRNA threonylcarbamoyladenosine biosynthesis protein TsaB [Oceanibacterium hippocampi]